MLGLQVLRPASGPALWQGRAFRAAPGLQGEACGRRAALAVRDRHPEPRMHGGNHCRYRVPRGARPPLQRYRQSRPASRRARGNASHQLLRARARGSPDPGVAADSGAGFLRHPGEGAVRSASAHSGDPAARPVARASRGVAWRPGYLRVGRQLLRPQRHG